MGILPTAAVAGMMFQDRMNPGTRVLKMKALEPKAFSHCLCLLRVASTKEAGQR